MQIRPENKLDFPLYEGKKEFHELYFQYDYYMCSTTNKPPRLLNPDGVAPYHRNHAKTFVKVKNPKFGVVQWRVKEFLYGYVFVYDIGIPRQILYATDRFNDNNHIYRQSPVARTGKYKNSIHPVHGKGLVRELGENENCPKGLVRGKRAAFVHYAVMDYDFFGYHYNSQRGWKRSKKRKQWQ